MREFDGAPIANAPATSQRFGEGVSPTLDAEPLVNDLSDFVNDGHLSGSPTSGTIHPENSQAA